MKNRNIFDNVDCNTSSEVFDILADGSNVKVERIVSPAGYKMPVGQWYDQDTDEFVILLKGSAVILFKEDAVEVSLKPGDFINIPRHKLHSVESTDKKEQTIWLAVHYN